MNGALVGKPIFFQVVEDFRLIALVKVTAGEPEQAGEGLRVCFAIVHSVANLREEIFVPEWSR